MSSAASQWMANRHKDRQSCEPCSEPRLGASMDSNQDGFETRFTETILRGAAINLSSNTGWGPRPYSHAQLSKCQVVSERHHRKERDIIRQGGRLSRYLARFPFIKRTLSITE
jgi:hypothetical protein